MCEVKPKRLSSKRLCNLILYFFVAEVLAGFVNSLFLLFIAFFIMSESVERLIEPPDVHRHDRLFVVSVLGFLVNLVGIYAFQHGGAHGHSHGGGGHSHGAGNSSHHGNYQNMFADKTDKTYILPSFRSTYMALFY